MKTKINKRLFYGVLVILVLMILGTRAFPAISLFNNGNTEDEVKEISVLLPFGYRGDDQSYAFLLRYGQRYEKETGIKVTYERLMAGSHDRYIMKRNSRLYMKEGPTLILVPFQSNARELVETGVALPLRGKIPNQNNLYTGLQDDFYLPIKIHGKTVSINRVLLNNLNIDEPPLNWTIADYDYLWERWSNSQEIYLNRNIYYDIVNMKIRDLELIDRTTGRVSFNNEIVKGRIQEIKDEVFSGKYILNENYTYSNYMRMLNSGSSVEGKESFDNFIKNSTNNFIMNTIGHHYNGLSSTRTDRLVRYIRTSLLLPDIRGNTFHMVGFVVNRNGKNIDLGLDFLNYLISEEVQFHIYESEGMAEDSTNGIVNQAVEAKLEGIERVTGILEETILLRKYMTSLLEVDQSHIIYGDGLKEEVVKSRFIRELTNIVFMDRSYSDKELSAILKKAENELTIYINE